MMFIHRRFLPAVSSLSVLHPLPQTETQYIQQRVGEFCDTCSLPAHLDVFGTVQKYIGAPVCEKLLMEGAAFESSVWKSETNASTAAEDTKSACEIMKVKKSVGIWSLYCSNMCPLKPWYSLLCTEIFIVMATTFI